jgi:hypothetical protein
MENHFIKYCRECQKVISQCRCPSKDKKVLWGVCRDCETKEIEVWHFKPLYAPNNGYYDTRLGNIVDMLNDCEPGDGYTIKKERMRAGVYYNLSKFEGF